MIRRFPILPLFVALFGATITSARAETVQQTKTQTGGAVLLVLAVANSDEAKARERNFVTEMGLGLDGIQIQLLQIGEESFSRLSLAEQLERIRPMAESSGAVATTWIEDAGQNTILLHLVALDSGRALVRIVEAERGAGVAAELALTACELLGAAYLFGPAPQGEAMKKVVSAVQEEIVSLPKQYPRVGILPLFGGGGGVYGHVGASLQLDVGAALELWITAGLFIRAGVVAEVGPQERIHDGIVMERGFEPGLGVGYSWKLGSVGLGPILGLHAPWSKLDATVGAGRPQSFSDWNFHATLGVDFRVAITDYLALFADAAMGMFARQEAGVRLSNGETVIASPIVDWNILVGAAILVN